MPRRREFRGEDGLILILRCFPDSGRSPDRPRRGWKIEGGPVVNHKPRVLFFSTGDSTRSQIAEVFLRTFAGHELEAVSTATQSVEADPLAREVMQEVGIDISGQHAKEVT